MHFKGQSFFCLGGGNNDDSGTYNDDSVGEKWKRMNRLSEVFGVL